MMRAQAILLSAVVVGMALAGCSGKATEAGTDPTTLPPLAADKGAVTGLVFDDRFRPVPDALVALLPAGLTTNSNAEGQFEFLDLQPGAYVVQVNAENHEAAPTNIDVVAGEYTETEVEARRTYSENGFTITTQYSVFSPCMQSGVLVASVNNFCMPDSSGDSYRPGIDLDLRKHKTNITFLVSEIKINQPDIYVFVVRCADGSSFGCGEYGFVDTKGGDYGKVVMKNQDNYMKTPNSINWTNKDRMSGLLFFYGTGGEQITTVAKPVGCMLPPTTNPLNGKPAFCRDFYGAGAKFGVEAKIVVTAFLGPPDPTINIDTYNVLGGK